MDLTLAFSRVLRIAWRVFTKGISRDEARRQVRVSGDLELGLHLLATIAIVA